MYHKAHVLQARSLDDVSIRWWKRWKKLDLMR